MPNELKPISTSSAQRYKEFKAVYLPWIVLIATAILAWYTWHNLFLSPTLMGEAQIKIAEISSPQNAVVQEVNVSLFDTVKQGDTLVVISPIDATRELDNLRTELDLYALKNTPNLTQKRMEINQWGLHLDILSKKIELAQARVLLDRAENDLKRNAALLEKKYLSQELYDLSLQERDSAKKTIDEIEKSLPQIEAAAQDIDEGVNNILNQRNQAFLEALQTFQNRLDVITSASTNFVIKAPFDGMISSIVCSVGQPVAERQILLTLHADKSDQIIGYLRQPYPVDPKPGMEAEIISNSTKQRVIATTQVETVASYLEPITNSLALPTASEKLDMGLPVTFKVPAELSIRPGEQVGILLRQK